MTVSRQTLSYLTRRFQEVGLKPDSKHGQNFLIDLNLLDLLVRSAEIGPRDVVLEVGTGLGSLTSRMAEKAAAVVSVEIAPLVYQLACEELQDFENITLLQQDALRNKNHLDETVLRTVRDKLAEGPNRQFKLCANLPYNIATPILSNLLTSDPVPVSLTATIQLELAERMIAEPSTKDYSALSIWMQALCDMQIVRTMSPTVFWPRPKVHSAILHIVPNAEKRSQIANLQYFHEFVRAIFTLRRKYLRGVLVANFKGKLDKADVDAVLAPFDLPVDLRAEQLPAEAFIVLADAFRQAEGIAD